MVTAMAVKTMELVARNFIVCVVVAALVIAIITRILIYVGYYD